MTHLWLSNNKISSLPIDEHVKLLEFDPVTGERSLALPLCFGVWQLCQRFGSVEEKRKHRHTRSRTHTLAPDMRRCRQA